MNHNDMDGIAELEVDFAVNFGNSFGQLATLHDLIGSLGSRGEDAARELANTERATSATSHNRFRGTLWRNIWAR